MRSGARGYVRFVRQVGDYLDALVHPSVRGDALVMARHRAFIAPRLVAAATALACFPAYLALRGAPDALEVLVFAAFVLPLVSAYFLSRTGRYESAHVLSSLTLTGLVITIAATTGAPTSFVAPWLVVVPLEAALSSSRRAIAIAAALAVTAAGLLMLGGAAGWLPAAGPAAFSGGTLAGLGVVSAALYATGLALGAETLARTSARLLDAKEERYRLLARHVTDVITRHGRGGAVLFASPAAERLFGVRAHELLGHGLFDRVHVADRPAYLTALAEAAEGGAPQEVEFRVRRDRGDGPLQTAVEFVWVEMHCQACASTSGDDAKPEDRAVVAVLREITMRKRQDEALAAARREAERANAAKGRFLAIMSHELRTPLNAIIGFSDVLMNEQTMRLDSERRREYAKLINESGHHLLAVVNGILDMSKLESGDFEITPEPFAPGAVIAHCGDLLALKAREAGLTLTLDVPSDLPEIIADKRALKQILINLLSNAIKFTDRGGEVKVRAMVEGAQLVITVEDNGIGIGQEDLSCLGRPFFQARGSYDRRHHGTGLGLSIVKALVSLHGGEIAFNSRLGEGTCITVRLPLNCEAARSASRRPSQGPRLWALEGPGAPAACNLAPAVKRRA